MKLNNLCLSRTKQKILQDITLSLPQTGLTVILGANGAGKSTLLHVLAGLNKVDSGTIDKGELNHSFIMPEPAAFYPQLTVEQQLGFVAKVSGQTLNKKTKNLILTHWQLSEVKDKLTQHLSLGYRQRLSLAQLSVSGAELLLLDEPMNGMDQHVLKAFKAQLLQWKTSKAIVMATHLMHEVQDMADWVVVMELGRVIYSEKYQENQQFNEIYQSALQQFQTQPNHGSVSVSA